MAGGCTRPAGSPQENRNVCTASQKIGAAFKPTRLIFFDRKSPNTPRARPGRLEKTRVAETMKNGTEDMRNRQYPALPGFAAGAGAMALGASLLAAPQMVLAQQATADGEGADRAVVLDQVTLTATSDATATTEGSGSYATPTASIARGATSLKQVPQTVTVVTRQALEDQNLTTMSDAMRKAPGIVVTQGEGGESSFYSRGFQIKNYQIDGLGTSYDSTYTPDFDMAIYDRLEILRGAEGLFSAAGEPGGTINLARKRPTDEIRSSAAMAAGSWNNRRLEADVCGPLGLDGALRGRLVGVWQDRDFFYKPSEEKKRVLYGILEYDLTPSTTISGGISYQHLSGNR